MTWVVRKTSLLGRALAAYEEVVAVVPGFGAQLEMVARWGDAEAHFDRLAAEVEPTKRDDFARQLLSLVLFAALDAVTIAPSKGSSSILERRAAVEARYAKLFSAIDTLDGAFEVPKVKIELTSTGEDCEEIPVAMPGVLPNDDAFLRSAVEAWRGAVAQDVPTSNDLAPPRQIRYQTRDATAALLLMRAFLQARKAAELGALHMGTLGRKANGAAHVRTFVILLDRRMGEAFDVKDIPFLTSMANAMLEVDGGEFFEDAVRKILERSTKRQAKV